jgi:hypothetical protein
MRYVVMLVVLAAVLVLTAWAMASREHGACAKVCNEAFKECRRGVVPGSAEHHACVDQHRQCLRDCKEGGQ